jgi:hypothetical protein
MGFENPPSSYFATMVIAPVRDPKQAVATGWVARQRAATGSPVRKDMKRSCSRLFVLRIGGLNWATSDSKAKRAERR